VHLLFSLLYLALVVGVVVEMVILSWEYIKGFDLKFSEVNAEKFGRKLDVYKARASQSAVHSFALPFGLIILGLMCLHYWVSFTPYTYAYIAVGWLLSAPLRRLWLIYSTIRAGKRLVKLGLHDQSFASKQSALQATRQYYAIGFEGISSKRVKKGRGLFAMRLRFLNKISWMWQWMRYLRVAGPVFVEVMTSIVWPVTSAVHLYRHTASIVDNNTGDSYVRTARGSEPERATHLDTPWWDGK